MANGEGTRLRYWPRWRIGLALFWTNGVLPVSIITIITLILCGRVGWSWTDATLVGALAFFFARLLWVTRRHVVEIIRIQQTNNAISELRLESMIHHLELISDRLSVRR
jgi:hypothetical protein